MQHGLNAIYMMVKMLNICKMVKMLYVCKIVKMLYTKCKMVKMLYIQNARWLKCYIFMQDG